MNKSMETLLELNSRCADCSKGPIHCINMRYGVFLCESCGFSHSQVGFPVREVSDSFGEEELEFLSIKGNAKTNAALAAYVPQWIATPKEFSLDYVRLFFVENKYIHMTFNTDKLRKFQHIDLSNYWYYLDEYTAELPLIRGPYTREYMQEICENLSQEYVWHPLLGCNWSQVSRVNYILNPPDSLSLSSIYDACYETLALSSVPFPHLKSWLLVTHNKKSVRKWVALMSHGLSIFPNCIAPAIEHEISLNKLEALLAAPQGELLIEIKHPDFNCTLQASPAETLEWFHAIRCAALLVNSIGDQIDTSHIDLAEIHLCNLKNSEDYVGEKVLDGLLKIQIGPDAKKTNGWIVLRTNRICYYNERTSKDCSAEILLDASSAIEDLPQNFGFKVVTGSIQVPFEADSFFKKESWVQALQKVIGALQSAQSYDQQVFTYHLQNMCK